MQFPTNLFQGARKKQFWNVIYVTANSSVNLNTDDALLLKAKVDRNRQIHIKPKMLLKIEKVDVTIYRADGSLLESGEATKSELNWKYYATASNAQAEGSRVVVVAYDRLEKSCTVIQHLGL